MSGGNLSGVYIYRIFHGYSAICLTMRNITYQREKSAIAPPFLCSHGLICYSAGSREILGYISRVIGRAAK